MATGKVGDSSRLTGDEHSVERLFEGVEVPEWKHQLTLRVFGLSLVTGSLLTIILMRLSLISTFILSATLSVSTFSLAILKAWTMALDKVGLLKNPITRQETAVMQSCVLGFSSIVYYGGFANTLLAMSELLAKQFDQGRQGNNWTTIKPGWMIMFLFLVNFIGLFTIIPAAKLLIVRLRLTYPSSCNAGHFLNVLHTPSRLPQARQQMWVLLKAFTASFFWGLFKWTYAGGPDCGFDYFPAFGLQAVSFSFFISNNLGFVSLGLICPHLVAISYLLGGILSWLVFWPIIISKEGIWYPSGVKQFSLHGIYAYKVILTSAALLGEGSFHIGAFFLHMFHEMYLKKKPKGFVVPLNEQRRSSVDTNLAAGLSYDDRLRTKMFLKGHIPTPIIIGGFLLTGTISAVVIPFSFPQVEPIHIAAAYLVAPILNFCNAYGVGISDFSFAPVYGKSAIVIFGSWIGMSQGGVLGSLVASSVVVAVMSPACDLMQSFKLAYLTLTSPRSLLISQAIGTAMGCVFGPLVFYFFYRTPNFGDPGSEYSISSAESYRGLAILATQGSGGLPRHCLSFAVIFFLVPLILNIVKELSKSMNSGIHRYIPYPAAMAIPFYLSANFAVDVCIGNLVLYVWKRMDRRSAAVNVPTVAAGMLAGDSMWAFASVLIANHLPPICVRFFSRDAYMSFQGNLKKLPF